MNKHRKHKPCDCVLCSATITRLVLDSGHVVVMLEIDGHLYAATYAPGSDVSDDAIRDDFRCSGYGRKKGNFRPYDQSRRCYV